MKITVLEKKKKEQKLTMAGVQPGYVFEICSCPVGQRATALKLENNKVVMLEYSSGDDWFALKDNTSWVDTPVKILGKISEIVVTPDE